uniref:Uncharacterized protein n=1 Tax=Plectus sambesii TaxID=2011161 RepID=A0A914VCR2_9BILA
MSFKRGGGRGAVDAYGTSSGVDDGRHSSAGERSAAQSVSESSVASPWMAAPISAADDESCRTGGNGCWIISGATTGFFGAKGRGARTRRRNQLADRGGNPADRRDAD